MSHRFIIERRFFAFGVPAVLCVIRTKRYRYKPYHTQNSRLKNSPVKFVSVLSYRNDLWYSYRYDGANNFGHEDNFCQLNNFGYEHKSSNEMILVNKIAQVEDCSPIRAVLFFSSANKKSNFSWRLYNFGYVIDEHKAGVFVLITPITIQILTSLITYIGRAKISGVFVSSKFEINQQATSH